MTHESAVDRLEEKLYRVDLARGHRPYSWKHDWIPLNLQAALVKAKGNRKRAGALMGSPDGRTGSTKDHGPRGGKPRKPKPVAAPRADPKSRPAHDLNDDELDAETSRLMNEGDFDNPRMAEMAAEMDKRESNPDYRDAVAKHNFEQEQAAAGKSKVLRRSGTSRAAREKAMRDEYETFVEIQFLAAEEQTNGNLLSKEGRRSGVQPRDLFTRTRRNLKWASEELQRFFAQNARMSYQEFRAGASDDDLGRAARKRSSNRGWESEFA